MAVSTRFRCCRRWLRQQQQQRQDDVIASCCFCSLYSGCCSCCCFFSCCCCLDSCSCFRFLPFSQWPHCVHRRVRVCVFDVCVCVCVCRACPAGSWRRRLVILVAFAKLAATLSSPRSFSLSLFLSPSLFGLTFRLSYFWKKQVYRVMLCAQDPALAAAAAPQKCTLASFSCRFLCFYCFFPLSLSLYIFSPLVLCAYSLLRHALILPFSCCCCCFSHSRSRLFRPYITHPCHIPFP